MADFPPPQSAPAGSPAAPVSAGLLAYALFAIGGGPGNRRAADWRRHFRC